MLRRVSSPGVPVIVQPVGPLTLALVAGLLVAAVAGALGSVLALFLLNGIVAGLQTTAELP